MSYYGDLLEAIRNLLDSTSLGNAKMSIEESAIVVPSDLQARLSERILRKIDSPAANTDYYLPETGTIDMTNFRYSTWYICASGGSPSLSICQLEISLDGGSTFRKVKGYEIEDADFVVDIWNPIKCDLSISHARLHVKFSSAPSVCELGVIKEV